MFTRDELIEAAGVQPLGGALPESFPGGAVDSRALHPGELFIALPGEQTDGHRFIAAAARAGAGAILCARPDQETLALGVPQLVVSHPLHVLQRLAATHLRRQPHIRVIAITGSNGKTSVKEATGTLLQRLAPTLKTLGNLNTETGLPLTLLRLQPEHQFAVLEMGAQWVGEITELCRIAPPEIAVVTVVGPEHLEYFGSLANVAEGESEAVRALTPEGIAILNDDDPAVRAMAKRTAARVLTYGHRPGTDVRALRTSGDPLTGLSFTLAAGEENVRVRLRIPGSHAVTTALAAAAVALHCGLSLAEIAAGLAELRPAKRRGEIHRGIGGTTLVDDSYNANRQSAIAAVELLRGAHAPDGSRKWFIFGDMLELGIYSPDEHAAVGAAIAEGGIDELVLVGADVSAARDAALHAGMPSARIHYFAARLTDLPALAAARTAAATYVREHLRAGDLLLVKGSLGTGMDSIVAALKAPDNASA
ncbi:MAG: UDP-N-acetylmuramoyl-tripeptide--D-alanyl-D-alanine ligase [Ktedonobacterales bacterium]|nr:MAG: UDP-N-acetylmuramoyl-tripeptide--D-alanyl-D-alanine ligase [Ktedonobacterales bacterium]